MTLGNDSLIKLVALDLDGTLLGNDGQLPARNVQRIAEAQAQGVDIMLATGKTRQSAVQIIDDAKREIESKLFGDPDEFPLAHLLQPFRQYYLQAEHSLPALIQIRHDWDQYLVPSDHPKGNSVPQGGVLPPLPSNDIWATAIQLH